MKIITIISSLATKRGNPRSTIRFHDNYSLMGGILDKKLKKKNRPTNYYKFSDNII